MLLSMATIEALHTLPESTRAFMRTHSLRPLLFTFKLTYEYCTQETALRKLLPAHVQVPASFETVGHIAHLNLTEEARPFGRIIARVLLDVRGDVAQRVHCERIL
jgi:tRNA (guanine37-N1)-methyltransferase